MSLADLIVHLCFPLKKVTIFYQIQSKGGLAVRALKLLQLHCTYTYKVLKSISIYFNFKRNCIIKNRCYLVFEFVLNNCSNSINAFFG